MKLLTYIFVRGLSVSVERRINDVQSFNIFYFLLCHFTFVLNFLSYLCFHFDT